MTHEHVEREIRRFIEEEILFGREADGLSGTDSLTDKGIIDSTGVLELVQFLEDSFGIEVEDHELVPANLDTIDGITRFVLSKKS